MNEPETNTYRPLDYDLEYGDRTADIECWKLLAESRMGNNCAILDLCCGTGRVTIPLAQHLARIFPTFKLCGVDISKAMLARGEERREELSPRVAGAIRLVYGDIRKLSGWSDHFDLALCAFNSFLHMISQEDQLNALRSIASQLKPGGYFMADIFNPDVTKLASGLGPRWIREEITAEDPKKDTLLVRTASTKYKPANQIIEAIFYYSKYRLGGNRELFESYWSPLELKVIFPEEWRLLLRATGYQIVKEWGDYQMQCFGNSSPQILFLCQKSK